MGIGVFATYLMKENVDIQKSYTTVGNSMASPTELLQLTKSSAVKQIKGMLQKIVDNSFKIAKKQEAAPGGHITFKHGVATVPLPDTDAPFCSC